MKAFWTIRMAYWIKYSGYEKTWFGAWKFANDECFQQYREDGYTPRQTIIEDMGHGL